VALTVVTGYYQQRQMTARTPESAQNPQMQMMGRIFPLFFGFIALQVPAGVVLYFVVSNIWQIGQQAIIFRQQDASTAKAKAKAIPPASTSSSSSSGGSSGGGGKASGNPSDGGGKVSGGNPSGGAANRNRRRRRRRKGR
jgi:YidC/Oxa1 family membrane protein insertase